MHRATTILSRSSAPSPLPCSGLTPPMTSSIRPNSVSPKNWLPECRTRNSFLFRSRMLPEDTVPTPRRLSGRITSSRFSRKRRKSSHFARRAELSALVVGNGTNAASVLKSFGIHDRQFLIARSGRIPSGVRPRGLMRMGPQRNFPQEWQCDPDLCPNLALILRRCCS